MGKECEPTLFEEFLTCEANTHTSLLLLEAIRKYRNQNYQACFQLNRFNISIDFREDHVIIDDEINPLADEIRINIETLERLLEETVLPASSSPCE